jgi:demethylmenaquinone methyltransferase/2-methoxy-6-polyprenyl-1,4-benzoquinol methylase
VNGQVVDQGMRAYYDRRASEYDDWWHGSGLFAERARPGWHEEVAELAKLLRGFAPARWLDVGCGTGFLTRHLSGQVVALDQSPEMIAIVSQRLAEAHGIVGEAVPLPFADATFERLLTSHFYGHLLETERAPFLREARRVAERVLVVDSALQDGAEREQRQLRTLRDGSTHEVYKRYFTADGLAAELGGATVLYSGRWFVAVEV